MPELLAAEHQKPLKKTPMMNGTIIDVNLKSVWRTFKATLPALRRAGGGAMTSTASAAGVNISGGMKLGAYTASKWGVVGLTRYFASEVEQDKIRVNCVCPGGMRTNVDESFGYNNAQDLAAAREKRNQMRWMSDPREVAYLHLFLCSHESSFITGQAILADGGGGLYLNYKEGARA
jgi:NAD(P)-dependent dehydrogenase (short-subunit alcohol dehydrogenase family)